MKEQPRPRVAWSWIIGVFLVAAAVLWWSQQSGPTKRIPSSSSGENKLTTPEADRFAAMAASFPGLSKEKQKWVWDSEHATFELETHFGKPFAKALKSRAHQELQQYFVDGFAAELPANSDRDVFEKGAIREERLRSQNEVTDANATKVIDYFLSLLENFETIDRIKFRVLKIKKGDSASDLWSTNTLLAVAGSDQRGPIELEVLSQVKFRFADDAEILGGKILESWRVTGETIRHCSQMLMEEVTDSVGLADLPIHDNWKEKYNWTNHFQTAVEDFDRDGFPDIAVANHNRPPLLLRSIQGKRFQNVAQSMGIRPRKTKQGHVNFLVGWIDYDNDGFPDLLMNGTLYRNVGGTHFEDVTLASGLSFQYNPFGCIIADYDCDGWLDMYVLYEGPQHESYKHALPWVGDHENGVPNQLWRNQGNGTFSDVTDKLKVAGGRRFSFAAVWMFVGDDRFPDLYIANDFGKNLLLRNQGKGAFEDITKSTGVGDFATSMGVSAGDLNNDGQSEIYVANMFSKMGRRIVAQVDKSDYPPGVYEGVIGSCAGNRLYSPVPGKNRFQEVSNIQGVNQVGWSHATTMCDLDGDGWLDLFSTAGYMSSDRNKPDG